MNNSLVPMVIKSSPQGERAMDIFSRLLEDRIIDLSSGVDATSCQVVRSCLLYLSQDSDEDIDMYIDSPGGSVTSGMSIVDTMNIIKPRVNVYCVGMAASMGSVLLAGATGMRYVLPHSQVMLHQVMSGNSPGSQVSDIEIGYKHAQNLNLDIKKFFLRNTKLNVDQLEYVMDRDTWFDAQTAVEWGLADKVVEPLHSYRNDVDTSKLDEKYEHPRISSIPST